MGAMLTANVPARTLELAIAALRNTRERVTIAVARTAGGAPMTTKSTLDADAILKHATPLTQQHAHEIQPFGHLVRMPIALSEQVCRDSVENLNQLLADTMTLRDLYKKHHWQVAGPTFYQLHLLFDKHYDEQNELVDKIAERIQQLGGVSLAMAPDIAETTIIPRPPKGREPAPAQISRLLHAHEIVLKEARAMARRAADAGDDGTNDLIVSDVVRRNELQVWFVAEHVVDTPLAHAE
jgi:starvation-inducible DNA-binding protein